MIEFITENLMLIPFLLPAYLILEWVEKRAGTAIERRLAGVGRFGPMVGSIAGVVPQCGFSAAAASLYAGGVVSVGTLIAVFLSTSDEMVPVLLSRQIGGGIIWKIVALKIVCAVAAGFLVDGLLRLFGKNRGDSSSASPSIRVREICEASHCGCGRHGDGILIPAMIHTAEMFAFLVLVSGAIHIILHQFGGEAVLTSFILTRPILGEAVAGLVGLIPNCAASVVCAEAYAAGAMSTGALLSSSLTGAGIGLLVLFRTNRHFLQNLAILCGVYAFGVFFGCVGGLLF